MSRLPRPFHRTVPILLLCLPGACVPDAAPRERVAAEYLRIVDAEDARPVDGPLLARLLDGASDENTVVRSAAVRALGRLERPDLAPRIVEALDDPSPAVRIEAAFALAQAHHGSDGSAAFSPLVARLADERDPAIRGELAHSLGRIRLGPGDRATALRLLLDATRDGDGDAPIETLTGAMLGLESLVRRAPAGTDFGPGLAARMEELTAYIEGHFAAPETVRIRSLSLSILGQAGRMQTEIFQRALRDNATLPPGVALRFMDQIPVLARPEMLRRSIANPSLYAVIESFRILLAAERSANNCGYLFAGARVPPEDSPRPVPHPIRVLAIDGLGRACPDQVQQRAVLREVEATLGEDPHLWQPASHALVSMARVFPGDAAARLSRHVGHENPFVRAWAARAAELLGNRDVLRALASDPDDNVRTAAVSALFALDGHLVDDVLMAQLERDDPQLLLTVARLLDGSPRADEALGAALDAFERISAAERETWRDPRVALLARISAWGDASLTERLAPYLADYDAQVAEAVAAALREWNRRPFTATPTPLPRRALPTPDELEAMDGASVLLHMAVGGTIEIELHPWLATTNVHRFWSLAREGYFDGLTLHRWAPNFVLQGGSPGANEYAGDGPYTRDEVGRLPHWRGTVGISTRGHDTGDGQIFINLMDNVRLDHAYTIVGTVVSGMELVDQLLEGAVIERAEVVAGD